MDGLDLHTVRIVKAIAETGSLTAAARQLGYSQPAVSQHLRRVEQRTGVALIERVGRRARLTEAGRVLERHAGAIATAMDAAAGELAQLSGLHTGTVRIAGFPSASPTIIPSLLAQMRLQGPGITITYVEAEPPEAVAAVRDGQADIAVTFSYPGDRGDPHGASARGLEVHTVGSDDLLLVLPKNHPEQGVSVDLAALMHDRWIAGCPRCRGHLLQVCEDAGFAPDIAFETDNVLAVSALVAQGIGVATLPRLALMAAPAVRGIRTARMRTEQVRTLHLVTARGADRVPSVLAVVATLRDVIQRATDDAGAAN